MMDYKSHYDNNLQLRSLDSKSSITKPETEEGVKKSEFQNLQRGKFVIESWQHSEWQIKSKYNHISSFGTIINQVDHY